MAASQEQLAKIREIVHQLDEHLQKPSNDNRRAPRINVRTPLIVMLLTGAGPVPVDIFSRNLSVSGIGFVSRRMFRVEERIAIMLRIPKLPAKLILSRVTFARYINNGLYEMGAEFLECISDPRGQGTIPKKWMLTSALQLKAPLAATPQPSTPLAAAAPAPAAPEVPVPAPAVA